MIARASFLASLVLSAVPAGAARCPGIYAVIRDEARPFGEDISCDDLRGVDRLLRINTVSLAEGTWSFSGEEELRETLRLSRGIFLPPGVLPAGWLERPSPDGNEILLVFGLSQARIEGLVAVYRFLQDQEQVPQDGLGKLFGRGALYDRLAVFTRVKGGSYPAEVPWTEVRPGGVWGADQPEPEGPRLCLPCEGWLCPRRPVACFSDFNEDGWEEVHLTGACEEGKRCALTVLEGARKGAPRRLLSQIVNKPAWKEVPDGWALVPKPSCSGRDFCAQEGRGLGDPSCVRPRVYRLSRASHKLAWDGALRDKFYRISVKRLPEGCPARGRPVVVWSEEDGFVRYNP